SHRDDGPRVRLRRPADGDRPWRRRREPAGARHWCDGRHDRGGDPGALDGAGVFRERAAVLLCSAEAGKARSLWSARAGATDALIARRASVEGGRFYSTSSVSLVLARLRPEKRREAPVALVVNSPSASASRSAARTRRAIFI